MPDAAATMDLNEAAPPTLNHVTGQKRAVKQLKVALDAHIADRTDAATHAAPAFPHVLIVGPPGVGKSLLAGIISRELGSKLHEEIAQNILSPGHLHGLLMVADKYDCIFVDEIHELHAFSQTTLYKVLEKRIIFLRSGPTGERKSVTLPPLTFVGATTDEWALTKPLRDRFRLILRLEHYSDDELAQLVAQRARRLGWSITDAAVKGIAARGRGTPRIALRLLEAARRSARAEGASNINIDHFRRMCEVEGYDALGLDPLEQKYLQILHDSGGVPVRLNVLATRLALPRQTIERVIESDLIRLGLIGKDDAGRMLTAEGQRHVRRSS